MTYTLSAPSKSGYKGTFGSLADAREKAADFLEVTPADMVEVEVGDSTSTAMTYCYASQDDADADQDGAYAVKYWEQSE